MSAFVRLTHRWPGNDLARQWSVCICDTPAARSPGARAFAIHFAALFAPRLRPDAARRRRRHQFFGALFAALVSIIWLKEPAGFVRGAALVIGFVGVLIVTNPGTNSLTLGALFALTNAVMYGTVTVAVRGMTRTESANTLVIWQLAVLAFFHSFLLLFGWRSPNAIDAAMLFGTGFTNAIGQWFWTKALQLAPAPAVTPFYYLMLVWALMFGFFIWGDVPSASLLIGSAIVVATGLFLFLREARLQRRLAKR